MQESALTLTNTLGLDIHEGSADDLHAGCLEARRIRNEVNRLDADGHDWDKIKTTVVDNSDHIKNTSQLLADKAFQELTTYHDHKDDGWGRPYPYIHEPYPIQMNHGEGYTLSLDEDTGDIHYRITALRYHHVRGTLTGSHEQLDRVRTALQDDEWRVGTAELVPHDGEYRLHVTTTHETHTVGSPDTADTVIGVDINEDCVALAAMDRATGNVLDSIVIKYPEIKKTRHEYFTKRKRMQQAGQTALENTVQTEERDYVHDQLHKKSREVVEWISQFTNSVIVFEDLKDMRDSIDYGTRITAACTVSRSPNSVDSSRTKPRKRASPRTMLNPSTRRSGVRARSAYTRSGRTGGRNGSSAENASFKTILTAKRRCASVRSGFRIARMRMCRLSRPCHECG